mmetsp:Transcript_12337/g.34603  ORF Transcript_12337/g.34603 Transcript_12337/m.34603 type:complete len:301 (+) Transcript_12337:613-1515(+)
MFWSSSTSSCLANALASSTTCGSRGSLPCCAAWASPAQRRLASGSGSFSGDSSSGASRLFVGVASEASSPGARPGRAPSISARRLLLAAACSASVSERDLSWPRASSSSCTLCAPWLASASAVSRWSSAVATCPACACSRILSSATSSANSSRAASEDCPQCLSSATSVASSCSRRRSHAASACSSAWASKPRRSSATSAFSLSLAAAAARDASRSPSSRSSAARACRCSAATSAASSSSRSSFSSTALARAASALRTRLCAQLRSTSGEVGSAACRSAAGAAWPCSSQLLGEDAHECVS